MVFLSSKDDYTIVFANHQFLNLYGLEEGAVTGRKCFASLHNCLVPCTEKSVADGQCGHKQVFETGLPVIVKHRHVLPDGSEKIFQISVSPLFDEKGAVSQIVHVTKDITEQEQLQEKLQISLVEQEMIFNNCPFFVTYLDPELRVININSSMEKLIGKKASEVQGKYCYEVWGQHAGDTTRRGREKICDICRVQDAMANGQNYSYERKVGDKYIDVTSSPVRDRNGKVIGALESGKDITEWKETTKALRLSENRYGCLFNHLNDAAFVFRLDGTLQETNEIAENRLGYSREEFLRMPQTQIEGFGFGNNHHKQLQKIRETGSLFFETVHVTKDGRAIPTEISASFIDLNGDSCVLALARDISERKQAEEVLRKNEEQLRLIAENISEAFWMADIEIGKTFYISPAYERIWGRSLQSLRENPRSFLEAIHPDDKARVLTDLERKKSGQPFDHEYRIVRPDGMVRWIWDRGFPVQEPAGKVHRYVGIAQDITERKQVEKVLREQESRYRTLLDQATDAIFVSDMNGRLIDVNREACEGLGYSREELLTLGICDVDPRFETEEHAKKAWEKLTPGRTLTIESSHRRKDGSLFPVEIHVGKLEIVGQPAILGIARDISERQQAEEELKTHQAFLQNALDALTHPFYVIDANDYTIKMSNQASHFGEYLEGTKCFQLTHNRSEPCGGDEHPCSLLEIKRTKQPVVVEHIHVDQAGKEQSVEIHAYPIFDSSGNLSQVIEYCLDISERKKGEEERRRLVTAIEQGIDSVVITDKQGMIQYVNPSFEKISGYSKEEVIGRNPRILQSGNHDALFYQEMWTTLASGKAWQGHLINRKKDGTLFEEEASITPVLNEAGEIINYVAVKRDVTEQRKLEEQLQQAQKMEAMGTLAGGIAHDFNNILSAILGYSEFVKQALPPGTAAREDIDQVINSGKRATALVQQILNFSRKTEQKLQPLRPHLIVEEVLQMLRSTLPTSIE
ncbi:MAG: PAS domain S-box protein, partial [Proteobacteria bacterium]|nr:PAS domain S-box protein [Pseudomonadota bacterium]